MTNEQMTEEVIRIEKTQATQQEQIKTLFGRADKQDTLIDVLRTQTATIGTLADGQARIEKKVSSLTGELDEIKQKPAKKWENAVDIVFKLVLTAMVGVLMAKMGL